MLNLHLLKIELTVEEYEVFLEQSFLSQPAFLDFLNRIPSYVIARCPICFSENIERLDTYSVRAWCMALGKAVYSHYLAQHCEHFALSQFFLHFHGIWPDEAVGEFGPEVPYVIGHLLEDGWCQAVIHALPVCRIEKKDFVPRYTLSMISYFSRTPEEAYSILLNHNASYGELGVNKAFLPNVVRDHWWDLRRWVSAGQLYWVDGNDPDLSIRTHDIEAFPYGDMKGRKFFHQFPYPFPEPRKSKRRRKSTTSGE